MRLENVQDNLYPKDPRRALCESKFFSIRPQPLEQHIYRLRLSQTQERVFWLHWTMGSRNGDFTSEMSLEEVARKVHCSISNLTRAYQTLKRKGLVRRTDPGRDPSRPYCQAIQVTEVLLPRDALAELLGAPDRNRQKAGDDRAGNHERQPSQTTQPRHQPLAVVPAPTPAPAPAPAPVPVQTAPTIDAIGLWDRCSQTLKAEFSESDWKGWFSGIQAHSQGSTLILFAPNQYAVNWLEKNAQGRIKELIHTESGVSAIRFAVGSRPTKAEEVKAAVAIDKPKTRAVPRQINTFSLARLRRQLMDLKLGTSMETVFREIVWAVEEGSLNRFEIPLAVNIALKKVRLKEWTRPNRMPPQWRRVLA